MKSGRIERVLVLTNARAGTGWSFDRLRSALDRSGDISGRNLSYQFSHDAEDGMRKARQAVASGVDLVLVVGGDGTISTVARALIGTPTILGVLPVGSGNGFARHFNIPLDPSRAAETLKNWRVQQIDVGEVNGRPFLVTCSMAWDAAIVRSFEKAPFRGVLPYVLAGVYEFFDYHTQPMDLVIDDGESLHLKDALLLTVANLTQFGGGARIAPSARPDDGELELVTALRQDAPKLIANIRRIFDGTVNHIPEVSTRRFKKLTLRRTLPADIQVDGELVPASESIEIRVLPAALNTLVPD